MKKLIVLAVMMIMTTASFSQTKLYSYLLESGDWNAYTEHWEYKKPINVNLTFTIAKTYVSIDDVANTYLTINSYDGEDRGTTSSGVKYYAAVWNCTDEKYRGCKFSMIKYDDGQYLITIMYKNYSFRYYIRTSQLSDF